MSRPGRRRSSALLALIVAAALMGCGGGEHAAGTVVVRLPGDVDARLQPRSLARLAALEQRLRHLDGVASVQGPATYLEQVAGDANRVLGAARGLAAQELLLRLGFAGRPSLANTQFVAQLIKGAQVDPLPSARWLFPDNDTTLIYVTPKPGVDADALRGALAAAVAPAARLANADELRVRVSAPDVTAPAVVAWIARTDARLAGLGLHPGPNLSPLPDPAGVATLAAGAVAPDDGQAELTYIQPARAVDPQVVQNILDGAPDGVETRLEEAAP